MSRRVATALLSVTAVMISMIATSLVFASGATAAADPAISFVQSAAAQGKGRWMSVPAPDGSVAGDLQVAVVALGRKRERVFTPSGWTRSAELRSGRGRFALRTVVFTSESADPVRFAKRGRGWWHLARTAYRGAQDVLVSQISARKGNQYPVPALSPSDPADVVVGGVVTAGQRRNVTVDQPWRERFDRVATRRKLGITVGDVTAGGASPVTGTMRSSASAHARGGRWLRSATYSLLLRGRGHHKPSPTPTTEPTPTPTVEPTPTQTTSPTPTQTTSPTPTQTTSPTPTQTTSPTSWGATITANGGLPWRSGSADNPGYANYPIPSSPSVSNGETNLVNGIGGQVLLNIEEYTEPIYYRSAGTAPVRTVKCTQWGCVGGNTVPLKGDEVVAPGYDGQLVVVDTEARRTYEFWQVATDADGTVKINSDGTVSAGSMSTVDLDGRGNKTASGQNLNITGSGVSRVLGVIRAHEVKAAATSPATAIPHALSVSLPPSKNCPSAYREPATKTDGQGSSGACIEEGARLQLDPSYNCSSLGSKMGQAVCFALQKYGAYNMDNGCKTICVYGQMQRSWSGGPNDYKAAGVQWDYFGLGIPLNRIRVLSSWHGR